MKQWRMHERESKRHNQSIRDKAKYSERRKIYRITPINLALWPVGIMAQLMSLKFMQSTIKNLESVYVSLKAFNDRNNKRIEEALRE